MSLRAVLPIIFLMVAALALAIAVRRGKKSPPSRDEMRERIVWIMQDIKDLPKGRLIRCETRLMDLGFDPDHIQRLLQRLEQNGIIKPSDKARHPIDIGDLVSLALL